MTPRIRRLAAAVVSAVLVWTAPGPHAHQAFAGEFTRAPGQPIKAAPQLPSSSIAPLNNLSAVGALPQVTALSATQVAAPVSAVPQTVSLAPQTVQAQGQKVEATLQTLNQPQASGEAVSASAAEMFDAAKPVRGEAKIVSVATVPTVHQSGLTRFAKSVRKFAFAAAVGLALLTPNVTQAQTAPPKNHQEQTMRGAERGLKDKVQKQGLDKKQLKKLDEAIKRQLKQAQNGGKSVGTVPGATPAQAGQGGQNGAQVAPTTSGSQMQPAPQAQPEVIVLSNDAAVSVAYDFRGKEAVTVGDRFDVVITVENKTGEPMVLTGLKGSVEDMLPQDVELGDSTQVAETITVQPGQSLKIKVEVLAFNSGELKFEGPMFLNTGAGKTVEIAVAVPEVKIPVKTVLTPDWKEKGLKDINPVVKKQTARWMWFVAIPLLILLLAGIERALAHMRRNSFRPVDREPLLARTRVAIANLTSSVDTADGKAFYTELYDVLERFMVDYHGLPLKQRDATRLAKDLKRSGKYNPGQIAVAAALAEVAESVRFGRAERGAALRLADLSVLRQLVDAVSGANKGDDDKNASGAGSTGLHFSDPLALILLVPLAAYAWWSIRHRAKVASRQAVKVSQSPDKRPRSLRERVTWLPRWLRVIALTALIVGVAGPRLGVTRSETFIPSTDTVMEIDLSGSMSSPMPNGRGGSIAKLDAAKLAIKDYVDEQRRGTSNRVGLGTFSDYTYQDVRLTTDYDALIARLRELETSGSTAVGRAVLSGIGHFAEINILELEDQNDPTIVQLQKLLREKGLPAALEFAKDKKGLMDRIIRPDRPKILVLFTDGQSNEGIHPMDAAKIAKDLGVKIYTVGIGGAGDFDQATMVGMAQLTGGQFYHTSDAARMREVLLEINRLEKAPSKIVASVSVNEYSRHFIFLALLAFLLELGLVNTRLRVLHGMLILGLGLPFTMPAPPLPAGYSIQTVQNATTVQGAQDPLPLTGVPEELSRANELYMQGRYDDALKLYAQALERFPDMPELYYNMGNAYFRLGEPDRAAEAYQKFIQLSKDPAAISRAYFNIGNAAIIKKDGEAALEMYKQALRVNSNNQEAKWNLEVLKKAQQEQQQKDGKQNQKQKKNRKGQKGQQGQQGQPGDQQGQPGDQQGQPGDQQGQGQPQGQGNKDGKSPSERLGDELGKDQKAQDDQARKGITRKGPKMWGGALAGLALGSGSTALTFSSPWIAAAAFIVLPIAAGLIAYGIHKKMQAARAYSPKNAPETFKSWWGRPAFLRKSGAILLSLALLTMSAAGPKSGYKDERLNFGGKDVLVTVDASHSMVYAEDGRLAKTKAELTDFIRHMQGTDRVGLVVFAGKARTASPLSIDYSNFEYKIGKLEFEARGLTEGSDLASAIRFGAQSFENVKKVGDRQRVMIVISDGDVFDQEVEDAIKAAREHDVVVYTIGVGKPEGTRMKVPNAEGTGTEYLIDANTDQPALTRLNETQLRRIASATGGAYFRAGPSASMSKIVERIAELQQGEKGDSIRSPRDVTAWFAWPALFLLLYELLALSPSLLRRPKGAEKKSDDKKKDDEGPKTMGGFLPVLLPLSAWPVILPFAVLILAGTIVVVGDVMTGGRLMRRAHWAWQRRTNFVQKGADENPEKLFAGLREVDQAELASFAKTWAAAKDEERSALVTQAEADEQLWREKLVWAFTRGADARTQVDIAKSLGRAAQKRLESPASQINELILLRDKLPWLAHVDAQRRLARLADAWLNPATPADVIVLQRLASFPDADVSEPARRQLGARWTLPVTKTKLSWPKRTLVGFALALSLALAGVSGVKTIEYRAESAKAAEASARIFFGEDLYIFNDRYQDERIATEVLPALRRWNSPRGSMPAAELDRAVQVLRESPDPKADNVLEVLLKHADVLPLSSDGEMLLLKTLVERDGDRVWKFMAEHLVKSANNPRMVQILAKMATVAASSKDDRIFLKSFYFLLSPNDDLRAYTAQLIYGTLDKNPETFFKRLKLAQQTVGRMPMVGLFIERFALAKLSDAEAKSIDASGAREILEGTVDFAGAVDKMRVEALVLLEKQEAAKAAGQKPQGPEIEVPESYLVAVLSMMDEAASQQPLAPALAGQLKGSVNRTTTLLIQEAEGLYPGLHERLIKEGIVLPDETSSGSYYDDHGHGGYYGGGTSKKYREIYKLEHLRKLKTILGEYATGAASETGEPGAKKKELAERADQAFDTMLKIGGKTGMLEGSSVGEKAADPINAVLKGGNAAFTGTGFVKSLREIGLAPNNGATAGEALWSETYSREDLVRLEAHLRDVATDGAGWDAQGAKRPLTFAERRALATMLDSVAAVRMKHYPQAGDVAPATGDAAFWARFENPAEAPLAMARLSLMQDERASDSAFQLAALKRLSTTLPAGADSAQAAEVASKAMDLLEKSGKLSEGLDALHAALAATGGASGPLAGVAKLEYQKRASALISSTNGLTTDDELIAAGVRIRASHRPAYNLWHLERFAGLAQSELAKEKAPTAAQKSAVENIKASTPKLLALGKLAGVVEGGTPAEVRADLVTAKMLRGYQIMPGTQFYDELKARGLTQANGAGSDEAAYKTTYTREDLIKIRQFMAQQAAQGYWLKSDRPLTLDERAFFVSTIDLLDRFIADPNAIAAVKLSDAEVWAQIEDPAQRPMALVRLATLSAAHKDDSVFMAESIHRLAALLRARGPILPSADVTVIVNLLAEGTADDRGRKQVLEALTAEIATGRVPALQSAAKEIVQKDAASLVDELTDQFSADADKAAFVKSGLLIDESTDRQLRFRVSHLKAISRETEAAVKRAAKLDEGQREVRDRVRLMAPAVAALGAAAGLESGETPDQIVADEVVRLMREGTQIFDGSAFLDGLKDAGLAPQVQTSEDEEVYYDSYPAARLKQIRDFVAARLTSGQGWDGEFGKDRALEQDEREFLQKTLKRLDEILAAQANGTYKLHGAALTVLASLGSTFMLSDLLPVLFLGAIGYLVYWFVRKYVPEMLKDDEPRQARRYSQDQVARAKKLEFEAGKLAKSMAPGTFRSRFVGASGSDFAGNRKYQPGDDVRKINWRASARTDEILTKRFELEKDMPLYLVFDASGSGAAGLGEITKREASEDVAGLLALAAAKHNVRVGAIIVTDKVEAFIPAKGGAQHAYDLVKRLQTISPESPKTDLKPALEALLKRVPGRAMVAVVSDLVAPDFKDALSAVGRRHDVRVFRMVDSQDDKPSPEVGLVRVQDAETGELVDYDTSSQRARQEQTQAVLTREAQIAAALIAAGASATTLTTDSDYLHAVQQEFSRKPSTPQQRN